MQNIAPLEYEMINTDKLPFKRWLVLLAYCSLAFANALGFVSYSPIWLNAAIYYGIPDTELQWVGNMYYLTYLPLAPLCIPLLEKHFGITLIAASLFSCIGAWVAWVGKDEYAYTLFGYFLIGVAEAAYLAIPVCTALYLSEIWFSVYERTLATCIGGYATLFSLAASYTFSSFFFEGILDQQEINVKIEQMNLIIAIINTFGFIMCLMFMRNPPEKDVFVEENRMSLWKQTLLLFTIEEYFLDLLTFSTYIGVGWAYITVISIQLFQYGYDQQQVGVTGAMYQGSGILVGFWASMRIDTQARQGIQPDYDIYIQVITFFGFVCLLFEAILIEYFSYWALLIVNFTVGVGLNAIYPLVVQAFVEKLYPIKTLLLSTWIMVMANLIGFILNYIIVLPVFLEYGLWLSLVIITPFQLYLVLFYKTKYRRFEMLN